MNNLLQDRLLNARIFAQAVAEDAYSALVVEYIGSSASGTVEVSSIGDILFKHGALGSEAADTTIGVPTLNGTIDVSDAAGNTFGEVIDNINASANWKAYLTGALRADNSDASTGSLLIKSATQAKVDGGIELYLDTSKVLHASVAVRGLRFPNGSLVKDTESRPVAEILEKGKWSEVLQATWTPTGSGASTYEMHRVHRLTGTATKIADDAGPATTAEQTETFNFDGRGFACDPDEYLVFRIKMASTLTAVKLTVAGRVI